MYMFMNTCTMYVQIYTVEDKEACLHFHPKSYFLQATEANFFLPYKSIMSLCIEPTIMSQRSLFVPVHFFSVLIVLHRLRKIYRNDHIWNFSEFSPYSLQKHARATYSDISRL